MHVPCLNVDIYFMFDQERYVRMDPDERRNGMTQEGKNRLSHPKIDALNDCRNSVIHLQSQGSWFLKKLHCIKCSSLVRTNEFYVIACSLVHEIGNRFLTSDKSRFVVRLIDWLIDWLSWVRIWRNSSSITFDRPKYGRFWNRLQYSCLFSSSEMWPWFAWFIG